MLTSTLGIVLCRVGAVLLFVQSATNLQYGVSALMGYPGKFDWSIVIVFLLNLIPVIAGVALWFFAERICRVNADSADIEIKSDLGALDLVAIGTLLLGLYAVFNGIVGALTAESMIWTQISQFRSMPEGFGEISKTYLSVRVGYASQVVLGLVLVMGRQGISRLLWKARYAGTRHTE